MYTSRDQRGDYGLELAFTANMDTNFRERFHSKSAYNTAKINDPDLDRLIDQFDGTEDRPRRRALALEIQTLLIKQMYAAPTLEQPFFPLSQSWVQNYIPGTVPHVSPVWPYSRMWMDTRMMPESRRTEKPGIAGR